MKLIHATVAALVLAAGFCLSAPASAHHSFAMFDMEKTLKIQGTVRTFQWTNPHTWLWVYAKDAKGGDVLWGLEGTAPGELARKGWSRESVKPGDKISVDVHPLKDGRPGGRFSGATLADGQVLGDVNATLSSK